MKIRKIFNKNKAPRGPKPFSAANPRAKRTEQSSYDGKSKPKTGGFSSAHTHTRPAARSSSYAARPAYSAGKPSFGAGKPSYGAGKPSFRSAPHSAAAPVRKSTYEGHNPRMGDRPAFRSDRPSFSKPSFGAAKPAFRSSSSAPRSFAPRPSFGSSKPSFAPRPSYSGSRPSFSSRPPSGGGRRGGGKTERIDFSRFVNKAVITEEVEHFVPEHKFTDFKITEELKAAVTAKGYVDPSPIQDRSIPHVLQGVDLVGIANTGTGKTAAFLIPLLSKVLGNKREKAMIIVPTRELAIQIEDELKGFTKHIKTARIFSVCCVGGANIRPQISSLKYEYNFVIGTPGRLKDLIDRKMIRLPEFNTIVLDEADRMLDMGFVAEMRAIMAAMPKTRQTLFFSATLSQDIEKLITEFLKEPVRISVKTRDTSKNVDQDIVRIDRGTTKIDVLHDLLSKSEFSKVLVFGRTKHGVEKISETLIKKGIKAASIHGNKNQGQRGRALGAFKDSKVQVLVATDVAARGLDISDVSHVINFDLPATYDDYVHRIGRTGRGNKKGTALTFIE